MKRLIAIIAACVVLASLCVPVLAAEAEFVPSVTYKPAPDVVPVPDPDGKHAIGTLCDEDGQIIDYVYEDCLVITPIAEVDTSTRIPEIAREILREVYSQLKSGVMELPSSKIDKKYNTGNMVVRDLFDVSFLCEEHPKMLAEEGVTLKLTFDLGVAEGETVVVMVYMGGMLSRARSSVSGEWVPVEAVNNGDGTVTCVFEDVCPVAFSVPTGVTPPEKTGDVSGLHWALIALGALAAIVVVTVIYRADQKKHAA